MDKLKEKKSTPYKARTITKAVKDVDLQKRTVTGLFNSYFYIDSDLDMLLPGAASKSIEERGVGSTRGNRIKHLKDHNWGQNIARIDVLDERTVTLDGKDVQGIYHESYYPESTDSTDMLIKIQEGLYDARSIGFRYEKILYCEANSTNEDYAKNWETYLPLAVNPEAALKTGYFWAVKEIMLWEGSDVSFGANQLTPLLGVKSAEGRKLQAEQLYDKLDSAFSIVKNGNLSDEGFHTLGMEIEQLKSYIAALSNEEPHVKNTVQSSLSEARTPSGINFYKSLMKI